MGTKQGDYVERQIANRCTRPDESARISSRQRALWSADLLDRLREIGKAAGYVDPETGQGQIASPIVEDLLWHAVGAYDAGKLPIVAEVTRGRIKRDGGNV